MSESENGDLLEIRAIQQIVRIIRGLPVDSRRRVIRWLEDRFAEYDMETRSWQTPLKGYPTLPPSNQEPPTSE